MNSGQQNINDNMPRQTYEREGVSFSGQMVTPNNINRQKKHPGHCITAPLESIKNAAARLVTDTGR